MSNTDVEFYDLYGRGLTVTPTLEPLSMNTELREFTENRWQEKNSKWKNSYCVRASELIFGDNGVKVQAGYMTYKDHLGIIYASEEIKQGSFEKGTPLMGISMYGLTADNMIPLQRRSSTVGQSSGKVMFIAGGWMSAMNILGKERCEDLEVLKDSRLYDTNIQSQREFVEETGLEEKDFLLVPFGTIRGGIDNGVVVSYVANIYMDGKMVKERMEKGAHEGKDEYDKVMLLPKEGLADLLRNQPRLQKENEKTFISADPREQILISEAIGGFVAAYRHLVSRELPKDIIEKLGEGGINFRNMPTSNLEHYFFS